MQMQTLFNRAVFGISETEASFARRNFEESAPWKREHLEQIGRTFIAGYRVAMDSHHLDQLAADLDRTSAPLRGFAYEGAAMALALTDHFWFKRHPQWKAFLEGAGRAHQYMLYVGYGWAVARLPWLRRNLRRSLSAHDKLLRWLIVDGYGFHEGYFYGKRTIERHEVPRYLTGYELNAFDQGLGRSLWFFTGANVNRVNFWIASFPEHRRADLWSGIGLAAAYAGGAGTAELESLRLQATPYAAHVGQGAAFAAKARQQAGNEAPCTHLAVQLFCHCEASGAAALTHSALSKANLLLVSGEAYESWRSQIRCSLEHWAPAQTADDDEIEHVTREVRDGQ